MPERKLVGRYQCGEVLGKGAFGKVYRGLNQNSGEFVAIKETPKANLKRHQLTDIAKETEMLSQLNHPNIVKVIESFETADFFYYVMEYVESGSLASVIKRFGALPELLLKNYTGQILTGLKYLHGNSVIHYDIKGHNVLITKDGVIKLADFGSASSAEFVVGSEAVTGSPNWMAPEVIQLEPSSSAADIWSVGCTVVELLTGQPPYAAVPAMTAVYKIATEGITEAFLAQHLADYLPGQQVSLELMDFLVSCFALAPSERPDAGELLQHPWIGADSVAAVQTPMKLEDVGKVITAAAQQRAALSLTMTELALFIDASANTRRGIRLLVEAAELRESGLVGQELLDVAGTLCDIYFEPNGVFAIPSIAYLKDRLRSASRDEELFDVIAEAKEVICSADEQEEEEETEPEAEEADEEGAELGVQSRLSMSRSMKGDRSMRESNFDLAGLDSIDFSALQSFDFSLTPEIALENLLATPQGEPSERKEILRKPSRSEESPASPQRSAREVIAPDFPISSMWSPKSLKAQKKLQKLQHQIGLEKQRILEAFEKEEDVLSKQCVAECEDLHKLHEKSNQELLSRQQFQLQQLTKRHVRDQESRRKELKKDLKSKRGRPEDLQLEHERQTQEEETAYQGRVRDMMRAHASEVQLTNMQQLQEVHTYDLSAFEEINQLHFAQQGRFFHLMEQQIRAKLQTEVDLAKDEEEEENQNLMKALREQGHGLLGLSDNEVKAKIQGARELEEKVRTFRDVGTLLKSTLEASLQNVQAVRRKAYLDLKALHETELEKLILSQRQAYEQSRQWESGSRDLRDRRPTKVYLEKAFGTKK